MQVVVRVAEVDEANNLASIESVIAVADAVASSLCRNDSKTLRYSLSRSKGLKTPFTHFTRQLSYKFGLSIVVKTA